MQTRNKVQNRFVVEKNRGGVNSVNTILTVFLIVGSWLCLPVPTDAQTFSPGSVFTGHKKLLVRFGLNPIGNPGPNCSEFPHHALLLWVNDDSGWRPSPEYVQNPFQRGWELLQQNISYNNKTYTLYKYQTCPNGDDPWALLQVDNSTLDIQLIPTSSSGWGTTSQVKKQDLQLYIDHYFSYWVQQSGGGWQVNSNWNGAPGSSAVLVFTGYVATVPMLASACADAAIDNRPICPEPQWGLEYPKFGSYRYLGGLFAGQVPQYYGSERNDTQTAPDLSGTGRSLLKFHYPEGFPSNIESACAVLFYRASPHATVNTGGEKGIGVWSLPNVSGSINWLENEVTWALMQTLGLDHQLNRGERLGSTKDLVPSSFSLERLQPEGFATDYHNDGRLKMRSELGTDQNRYGLPVNTDLVPVVMPVYGIQTSRWHPQGAYLGLVVALDEEETSLHSANPYGWYYFIGKDYGSGVNGSNCPRLWFVYRDSQ